MLHVTQTNHLHILGNLVHLGSILALGNLALNCLVAEDCLDLGGIDLGIIVKLASGRLQSWVNPEHLDLPCVAFVSRQAFFLLHPHEQGE